MLVCQSGGRAAQAERRLAEVGMTNVHILQGGMAAWAAAGGEIRHGTPRWSLERQVRLTAGALVAGAVAASAVVPAARWVAGAVGAGLVVAAVSDTCAMGALLARLPYNRRNSCDVDKMVAALTGGMPSDRSVA